MKTIKLSTSAAVIALGMAMPFGSAVAGNPAYVGDLSGATVTDAFGNCVRTIAWDKSMMTPDCGGQVAAADIPEQVTMVAPPAAVQKATIVELSDSDNVLFAFDSAQLTGDADQHLNDLLSKINQYDEIDSISITGHTDSTGPDSYNQGLSERRAASVRDYLASKGISSSVISTKGMGESAPATSNATREGRAQNRRVIIEVNGKTEQ